MLSRSGPGCRWLAQSLGERFLVDQQKVLVDLLSECLLFGWKTFNDAPKAGCYANITREAHELATGAPGPPGRLHSERPHVQADRRLTVRRQVADRGRGV